jgi:hypothetical protein
MIDASRQWDLKGPKIIRNNCLRPKISLQTSMRQNPITTSPIMDASHRPMRCPRGPNKLVPIKYDMLAGKNVTPCFHRPAPMVSIIQIGSDGSSIAIPMLAKVMAPG